MNPPRRGDPVPGENFRHANGRAIVRRHIRGREKRKDAGSSRLRRAGRRGNADFNRHGDTRDDGRRNMFAAAGAERCHVETAAISDDDDDDGRRTRPKIHYSYSDTFGIVPTKSTNGEMRMPHAGRGGPK